MLVYPPWTDDHVASLNEYQHCGVLHKFTGSSGTALIATPDGWVEREGGPVVQDWAHEFMADWAWWFQIGEFPWLR